MGERPADFAIGVVPWHRYQNLTPHGRSALGAATGLATSTFAAPTIVRAATHRALDFNDPEDQLYALVKMTGDLEDGKETVSWMKGIVHGILEDGKILEPLSTRNLSGILCL